MAKCGRCSRKAAVGDNLCGACRLDAMEEAQRERFAALDRFTLDTEEQDFDRLMEQLVRFGGVKVLEKF